MANPPSVRRRTKIFLLQKLKGLKCTEKYLSDQNGRNSTGLETKKVIIPSIYRERNINLANKHSH